MPRLRKEDLLKGTTEGTLNKPHQRFAANARERSRMRVLSKAFSRLKTTLPWVPPDTKLSKLDTLRLASSYIAHLKQILDQEEAPIHAGGAFIHPLNLTWPFTFSSRALGCSPTPPLVPTTPTNKRTHGNIKIISNNNNTVTTRSGSTNNTNKQNAYSTTNAFFNGIDTNANDGHNNNNFMDGNSNSNSQQRVLVYGTRSHDGFSPISDTSSIPEHEIVSQ